MQPSVQAIRALAVEFVWRVYQPIVITAAVIAVVALVGSILLTQLSSLWWILVVFVSIGVVVASIIAIASWFAIKVATPQRTKEQKRQAKQLVDKLQRLSEVAATPAPVLFFKIMLDVRKPSNEGFIGSLTADGSSVKSDFFAFKRSFESPPQGTA